MLTSDFDRATSSIRYESGQQYLPHTDYFPEEPGMSRFIGRSGNRIATVLIYLHSPEEGGHTIFPSSPGKVEANATAVCASLFPLYCCFRIINFCSYVRVLRCSFGIIFLLTTLILTRFTVATLS
jgi:hypothetical protein